MDQVRLINEAACYKQIAKTGNVRHIFAGHVHKTISVSCRGILSRSSRAPSTSSR